MTKDFSKYSNFIQQFRGVVLTNTFEVEFNKATKALPASERFLLKMELKRLAQPCTRLIDLRGHVDGECVLYEDEHRTHYLDDVAIQVFEESMSSYGHYCFGVYEATQNTDNNFKVIYQKESALIQPKVVEAAKQVEKLQYPATRYQFGPYVNRSEERMNFAISLELFLEDDKKLLCTSSDLSVNGCKFRLAKGNTLQVGQEVLIRFVGLEHEMSFYNKEGYRYIVCNVHVSEGNQSVGVKRIYDNEESDIFKDFLLQYIQTNKRKYRLNLDNTIKALQARIFEQYLIPNINELPVFFSHVNTKHIPKYALTTDNNRNTFEYWLNEKKESTLHCLFTPDRIRRLLKDKHVNHSIIIYSFVHHHQNQCFFYTADDTQFEGDKAFMKEFLAFAVKKTSFAVFQLSLIKVNPEDAYSPITIPDGANIEDKPLNEAFSAEVVDIIDNIKIMGVVTDLTTPALLSEYQEITSNNQIDFSRLKKFGHKRIKLPFSVEATGITYSNDREEPRFTYQTPVTLISQKTPQEGISTNFSISGLKVELLKRSELNPGDIVYLTFPKLQKITKTFELTKLPYEVVRISKARTTLNLKVHVQNHRHIGRAFFKLLIEKNKNKLTSDEYMMMTQGLLPALRNVYSGSILSSTLFVQSSGSRYKFDTLVSRDNDSVLMKTLNELSEDKKQFNLYPLLKNNISIDVITYQLKQQHVTDTPYSDILFIAIDSTKRNIDKAVNTRLIQDFDSYDEKQSFIKDALKKGQFFCVQIKLSRVGEANIEHLNPELSYISAYAIHRGKQLEKDIYSVAGIVQLYDITQQMLVKYK